MKTLYLTAITLFCASFFLHAQSFSTQVLNKEQFLSAASLIQDYDGDGDLDIVTTRWSPAGIYVLENDETKQFAATPRSEERRVGKECRSRWSPYH